MGKMLRTSANQLQGPQPHLMPVPLPPPQPVMHSTGKAASNVIAENAQLQSRRFAPAGTNSHAASPTEEQQPLVPQTSAGAATADGCGERALPQQDVLQVPDVELPDRGQQRALSTISMSQDSSRSHSLPHHMAHSGVHKSFQTEAFIAVNGMARRSDGSHRLERESSTDASTIRMMGRYAGRYADLCLRKHILVPGIDDQRSGSNKAVRSLSLKSSPDTLRLSLPWEAWLSSCFSSSGYFKLGQIADTVEVTVPTDPENDAQQSCGDDDDEARAGKPSIEHVPPAAVVSLVDPATFERAQAHAVSKQWAQTQPSEKRFLAGFSIAVRCARAAVTRCLARVTLRTDGKENGLLNLDLMAAASFLDADEFENLLARGASPHVLSNVMWTHRVRSRVRAKLFAARNTDVLDNIDPFYIGMDPKMKDMLFSIANAPGAEKQNIWAYLGTFWLTTLNNSEGWANTERKGRAAIRIAKMLISHGVKPMAKAFGGMAHFVTSVRCPGVADLLVQAHPELFAVRQPFPSLDVLNSGPFRAFLEVLWNTNHMVHLVGKIIDIGYYDDDGHLFTTGDLPQHSAPPWWLSMGFPSMAMMQWILGESAHRLALITSLVMRLCEYPELVVGLASIDRYVLSGSDKHFQDVSHCSQQPRFHPRDLTTALYPGWMLERVPGTDSVRLILRAAHATLLQSYLNIDIGASVPLINMIVEALLKDGHDPTLRQQIWQMPAAQKGGGSLKRNSVFANVASFLMEEFGIANFDALAFAPDCLQIVLLSESKRFLAPKFVEGPGRGNVSFTASTMSTALLGPFVERYPFHLRLMASVFDQEHVGIKERMPLSFMLMLNMSPDLVEHVLNYAVLNVRYESATDKESVLTCYRMLELVGHQDTPTLMTPIPLLLHACQKNQRLQRLFEHPAVQAAIEFQFDAVFRCVYEVRQFLVWAASVLFVIGSILRSNAFTQFETGPGYGDTLLMILLPSASKQTYIYLSRALHATAALIALYFLRVELQQCKRLGVKRYFISNPNVGVFAGADKLNLFTTMACLMAIGTSVWNMQLADSTTYLSPAAQGFDSLSAVTSVFMLCMNVLEWVGFGGYHMKISIMFRAMLAEVLEFLTMFIVMVLAFAFAFHILLGGVPGNGHDTLPDSIVSTFTAILGDFVVENFTSAELGRRSICAIGLFFLYIFVSVFVVINMLIAMMTHAFDGILDKVDAEIHVHMAKSLQSLQLTAPGTARVHHALQSSQPHMAQEESWSWIGRKVGGKRPWMLHGDGLVTQRRPAEFFFENTYFQKMMQKT